MTVHRTLMEAIDSVINPTNVRRDLDIRSFAMIAGLSRRPLTEVYQGKESDFDIDESEASRIHSLLEIPKINNSVDHYTGSGSVDINNAMWEHWKNETPIPNHIQSHINKINSVLKPETSIPGFKLYSGVRESPIVAAGVEWNSTRPKKILHLPAFTSATTNFNTAAFFTDVDETSVHHASDHHGIVLPNSRHVIQFNFGNTIKNAASLVKHSGAAHEEEVLLGGGHVFELHPRPTHVGGFDDPLYVWKATKGPRHLVKQLDFSSCWD